MKVVKNRINIALSTLTLAIGLTAATGCEQSEKAGRLQPLGGGLSIDERLGAPQSELRFEDPVRIFAGEAPVSVEDPGYACPTIADVDGDGADDLVVGQFANGQMMFYRNENKPGETPKFEEGKWINSGDEVASVPGVW